MYSALILDDEIASINSLKLLLQEYCKTISTIYTAQTINEASLIILRKKPNIVFSDIKMPDMNGIDFLNSFEDKSFKSIIVTAYTDYGLKAIKAGVNDYIVKPVISTELIDSVTKITELITTERANKRTTTTDLETTNVPVTDKILLKDKENTIVVSFDEVVMIVADNNYSQLYLENGKVYTSPHTLKWYNDKAPKHFFYRAHKTYLININFIEKFSSSKSRTINMINGLEATLASNKVSGFKKFLKK